MMKKKNRLTPKNRDNVVGKRSPVHLDTQVRFGKYKQCSVEWVIQNDPQYLDWLVGEKAIELDNQAYEKLKDRLL